ncbi:esterase family protein [Salibacterium salarium]|uniref:Esterase family protein n=2 Tax=Salibacterium salarium TaxID=284579 RepID=A0A3R9PZ79_9BACI|nr:esterase family protein [Salibacterium salarium]
MRALTFHSTILNHTFDLHVYLPPNYSRLYTYHLAITQDGRDYFQLGRIGRKMETALEEGAEDTIVIGIPYPSVEQRRYWYHPDSEGSTAYIQFLVKELLPFLEDTYKTPNLAQGRTLIGDSLGASISLLAALFYPYSFSRVMMHSPFVNDTVLQAVRQTDSWHSFDIYHTIGTEETNVETTDGNIQDFLSPNRDLYQLLQKKGSRYYYHEFEGGHFWKYWEKDLPDAIRFMFEI